jgi:hypothetical protein
MFNKQRFTMNLFHKLSIVVVAFLMGFGSLTAEATVYSSVNFDDETFGDWATQSVASDADWSITTYSGVTYAYVNGYGADEASEDWLISPSLDLSGADAPALSFVSKVRYSGGSFGVYISTDYSGDVTTATWTELSAMLATGSSWTPSGSVSLDSYKQSGVYIAFKYTSDGTGPGDAPEWQVDDISIKEVVELQIQEVALFSDMFEGADLSPWTQYNAAGQYEWQKYTYSGNGFARISGFNDPEGANNDWLISPEIDLYGFLNPYFRFENAKNFSGDDLRVFVIEDYDGVSDPALFDKTEFTFDLSTGGYEFVGSGDLSLSDFLASKIHIAFQYTSEANNAAIWEVDNFGVYAQPVPLVISQYVETSSGTMPKGIEIWNISGYDIDFSDFNLGIYKQTNGGSFSMDFTVNSGILPADEVMVIGTADMETYLNDNERDVLFFEHEFFFNGDDALGLEMDGLVIDIFGEPGVDPGSAWEANGVSTRNQNIQLIYADPISGAFEGWSDPSLRFEYVADGLDLKGFGLKPTEFPPKTPCDRDDLFISEYSEGGGNNKYIEIYNGVGHEVQLSDYQIWMIYNDGTWSENTLALSGTLANDEVYVIANGSADQAILDEADLIWSGATWNGNDAVGLAKRIEGSFELIDAIGVPNNGEIDYPGINEFDVDGWFVAGIFEATSNFTLVRKEGTYAGNTNWYSSAGATLEDSEWLVLGYEDWSNLGFHATDCNDRGETAEKETLVNESFESGGLAPWTTYSVSSNLNWEIGSYSGRSYAYMNGYGADEASDEWLISPPLDLENYNNISLNFENARNFGGPSIQVWISTNYTGEGNPNDADWTELTGFAESLGGWTWVNSGDLNISDYKSPATFIAFRYVSDGPNGGEAAGWEIDDIMIKGEIPNQYPDPYPLAMGDYHFTEWASNNAPGTYPDNMMFFLTDAETPSLTSNFSHEYKMAYYYNGGTTVEGMGTDGFAFRNGTRGGRSTDMSNYGTNLGAAVLPLNTTGRNNIRLEYTGKTISGTGDYAIDLQFRIGREGEYMSTNFVYNAGDGDEGEVKFGPVTLPDMLEDHPYVELRWVFYAKETAAGEAPVLAIDDITVTSESQDFALVSPLSTENVCNEVNAPFMLEWHAPNSYFINIDISTNFGASYNRLMTNVPAGEGSIEWNIPRDVYPGSNITLRISDSDDPTIFSESIDVTISDAPQILDNSDSKVVCINDEEHQLFVKADGTNITYQWLKDGVVIPGATSNVYNIEGGMNHNVSAFYTCVVSGDEWCAPAVTNNIAIYVSGETIVTREPHPVYVLRGETAWFEVEAHMMGVPPQYEPEFQWYQVIDGQVDLPLNNTGKISGAHSSVLSISDVQEDYFNTSFYCEISTPCGDPVRTKIHRINEVNLKFITQPAGVEVCMDEEIKLSVLAETSTEQNIMYKWYKDGTPVTDNTEITGSDTPNLTITPAMEEHEGTYYATAFLENMPEVIVMSEEVNVMVNMPAMITSAPDAVINVEPADELNMAITATGDNLMFSWEKDVDGTWEEVGTEATFGILVVREEDAGNYRAIAYNDCGADTTETIVVNVTTGGMVSVGEVVTGGYVLKAPMPNPVNHTAQLSYYLPLPGDITLTLNDALGNEIAVIANGYKAMGEHSVTLNVNEYNLSSGVYFYTLKTGRNTLTQRLMIIK